MNDEKNSLIKLNKDLKTANYTLTDNEARFLVDAYYQMQENRKRSDNQVRSMAEEPHEILAWLADNSRRLENYIKIALDYYSNSTSTGQWARSQVGIGPVIAAGLMAHIDITKAPTAGHIWNFAGLNPSISWGKGERRPWNASLKTLCWKIGESFVKVSGRDDAFYGHIYIQRKNQEWKKNLAGDYSDQATDKLANTKIGKATDAYKWYSGLYKGMDSEMKPIKASSGKGIPMLPPAHIQSRSKRYAVKLFLSHYHHVAYLNHYNQAPPKPYAIDQMGHAHIINPPGLAA